MPYVQRYALAIAAIIAVALVATFFLIPQQNHHHNGGSDSPNHHHQDGDHSSNHKNPTTLWGVDTASKVNNSLYQCVSDHYGKPKFWGRYMKDNKGASKGLSKKEISYIHDHDGKILLIYNHLSKATGHKKGKAAAKQAISFAKDLDAPKGVALFADVEPSYPVDSDFIQSWTRKVNSSKYKPGLYGEFSKKSDSKLRLAYNTAEKNIDKKPILWSSQPRPGTTSKKKAPDFNPDAPKSPKDFVWQYGISAKKCSIDTDLVHAKKTDFLW